jgi:hypothetical protein
VAYRKKYADVITVGPDGRVLDSGRLNDAVDVPLNWAAMNVETPSA